MPGPDPASSSARPKVFRIFAGAWLVWFALYGVASFGLLSLPTIQRFSDTVDHVESLWVKMIFLNIPLQLVLAALSLALFQSRSRPAWKVGWAFATVNTVLIAVHIAISLSVP